MFPSIRVVLCDFQVVSLLALCSISNMATASSLFNVLVEAKAAVRIGPRDSGFSAVIKAEET